MRGRRRADRCSRRSSYGCWPEERRWLEACKRGVSGVKWTAQWRRQYPPRARSPKRIPTQRSKSSSEIRHGRHVAATTDHARLVARHLHRPDSHAPRQRLTSLVVDRRGLYSLRRERRSVHAFHARAGGGGRSARSRGDRRLPRARGPRPSRSCQRRSPCLSQRREWRGCGGMVLWLATMWKRRTGKRFASRSPLTGPTGSIHDLDCVDLNGLAVPPITNHESRIRK